MDDTYRKSENIAAKMNGLLRKHGVDIGVNVFEGIDVGVKFCRYGMSFNVWLPDSFETLITEVVCCFKSSGYSVREHRCDHFDRADIIQITAGFKGT